MTALLRALDTGQGGFTARPPRCLPTGVESVPEQSIPGQELIGSGGVDVGDMHVAHRVMSPRHEGRTY